MACLRIVGVVFALLRSLESCSGIFSILLIFLQEDCYGMFDFVILNSIFLATGFKEPIRIGTI